MRGIQHNFNNQQINQLAMEQAAQSAKNQQANRARSEAAEKILEKEKSQKLEDQKQAVFSLNPDGQKKQNQPGYQNTPNKKDDSSTEEVATPPKKTHIDIKI